MKKDGDICLVAPGSAKCLAIASSDTAPVLVSLGAEAILVSPQGERRVQTRRLISRRRNRLFGQSPRRILKGLLIPRQSLGRRNAYLKLRRRGSFDFPILGVAATVDIDERGECRHASVVLTAVASAPKIVTEATSLLQGKKITLELIDAVADAAAKDCASARQRRFGLLVSQAHGESVYAKSFGAGGRFRSSDLIPKLDGIRQSASIVIPAKAERWIHI